MKSHQCECFGGVLTSFCNLIFGVPLRRGNGHKGGEVKVQNPRLGGLWWSAWELEKGKLWLEYEWNRRRGGEERGKKRGEEKGGLWLNYSPHHGAQRRTFTHSAQAWAPLPILSDTRRTGQGGRHRATLSWERGEHPIGLKQEGKSCWIGWKFRNFWKKMFMIYIQKKGHYWHNFQNSICGSCKLKTSKEDLINFSGSPRLFPSLVTVICLLEPHEIGQVQPVKEVFSTLPAQTDVFCFCSLKRPQ